MLQQNVLAKPLDTNNLKLRTVLLSVEFNTTMALAILTEDVILSVRVLVRAVGVKLLKVMRTEITGLVVRQTRHKIPTDRNWKRTR